MKKRVGFVFLIMICIVVLSACSGESKSDEKPTVTEVLPTENVTEAPGKGNNAESVVFSDPLVERCVREALGKSEEEKITAEECASLKELKIDCEKGHVPVWYATKMQYELGNYVDLSDLKLFPGLTSLEICNHPGFDLVGNMDAIANCSKLETLRLNDSTYYTNYFWDWQYSYKDYAGIVQQLPELKELILDGAIKDKFKDWIRGENKDLVISSNPDSNIDINRVPVPYPDGGIYRLRNLDEIPKDIEDLVLLCQGTIGEVDFKYFNEFTNLKTLMLYSDDFVLSSDSALPEDTLYKVTNIEALKENKKLYSLSICGASGNFEGIGELTGLKELAIVACRVNDTSFITKLNDLRELTYQMNISNDFSENLKKADMKNLKFLGTATYYFNDGETFTGMDGLEVLKLTYTSPVAFFEECYTPEKLIEGVKECKNLKYFSYRSALVETDLDVSSLASMDKLQYVYLEHHSANLVGAKDLIAKKGLKELTIDDASEYTNDDVTEWLQAGVENDSLCKLMIGNYQKYPEAYEAYRLRKGDEWLRGLLTTNRSVFQKAFENHMTCGAYDALVYSFDSVESIEAYIDE